MTNELEKKFFDTFGIEPEYKTCIFKYCKYEGSNCDDVTCYSGILQWLNQECEE